LEPASGARRGFNADKRIEATGAWLAGAWLAGLAESALNLEIFCRGLAFIRDLFVFDDLSFIETAQAGPLDCRDVDENIFATALRLNEAVALLRIEPLHRTFSHQPAPNA
jgi:hypothetical protein